MADLHGAEQLLRHPVAATLTDAHTAVMIAASVAGDPPRTRLAWIDWRGATIVARLVCPPGLPSRMRPVVATDVRVDQAGIDDRVIAIRAADGIAGVQLVVAEEAQPPVERGSGPKALHSRGSACDTPVMAIDALSAAGEPVGRLDAAGIGMLDVVGRARSPAGSGSSHGLAAGFGAGHWVADVDDATFEAGFTPRVAVPGCRRGSSRGMFHIEPDVAYPAAAPSVAVAWGREPQRVLVRQTPGQLASPARWRAFGTGAVGPWPAGLMARGRFATLVWQAADRAFGVQVVGFDAPGEVALRVAASM